MNSDKQAFLNAIIANPDDDGLRLIYADWLDENGDPEHAELIRVQIELSKVNPKDCNQGTCNQAGYGSCIHCRRVDDLSSREKVLVDYLYWKRNTDNLIFTYSRGLPDKVECTSEDWEANADAILAENPIRIVELADLLTIGVVPATRIRDNFFSMPMYNIKGFPNRVSVKECIADWESQWSMVKFIHRHQSVDDIRLFILPMPPIAVGNIGIGTYSEAAQNNPPSL